MSTIQIPEAPDNASTPVNSAPPADPQGGESSSSEFLDMVRNRNEERAGSKSTAPEDPEQTPAEEPEPEVEPEPTDSVDIEVSGDGVDVDPERDKPIKKTKEDNIKGLRTALKSERDEKAALQQQLQEAQQKLEQGGDVEELKTKLSEASERISELEKYEKLLGLKQSKEFKEKYIDGVDNLLKEAKAIAKDYDVKDDLLKQLVATGNRKQLNQLLGQNFDPLGANDIRPIILEMQKLLVEKKSAEIDPGKVEKELLEATEKREKTAQATARRKLTEVIQDSWKDIQTLYSTKESGVEALQEKPGDENHNNQRIEITKKAAKNLGDTLGILVKNGLREVPEDVAKTLSAQFQLSEVAGHLIAENKSLAARNAELQKKLQQQTSYRRPLANGSGSRGAAPGGENVDSKDIAAKVFQSATDKLSAR